MRLIEYKGPVNKHVQINDVVLFATTREIELLAEYLEDLADQQPFCEGDVPHEHWFLHGPPEDQYEEDLFDQYRRVRGVSGDGVLRARNDATRLAIEITLWRED